MANLCETHFLTPLPSLSLYRRDNSTTQMKADWQVLITVGCSGCTWMMNWYAGMTQCCSTSLVISPSSFIGSEGNVNPSSMCSSDIFNCHHSGGEKQSSQTNQSDLDLRLHIIRITYRHTNIFFFNGTKMNFDVNEARNVGEKWTDTRKALATQSMYNI